MGAWCSLVARGGGGGDRPKEGQVKEVVGQCGLRVQQGEEGVGFVNGCWLDLGRRGKGSRRRRRRHTGSWFSVGFRGGE